MALGALLACRADDGADGAVRTSDQGRFRIAMESEVQPIPLHALHAWRIRITTPDGEPVPDAVVQLDGGMPEHAHGLPTTPEIVPEGPGSFRVDGMKFSMPGRWTLTVTAWAGGARDAATFDVVLP